MAPSGVLLGAPSDIPAAASLRPYAGVLSAAHFPRLAVLLLGAGLFFFAWFLVDEVRSGETAKRKKRNVFQELTLALLSSVFLGFGSLFLLLWNGVYV